MFGVAFILVENHNAAKQARVEQMRDITFQMAILIGLFQLLAAAFPGTSRSGATIIGALLIGVSRKAASEFTFILAIPVMLGASLLKLMDFGLHLTGTEWAVRFPAWTARFCVRLSSSSSCSDISESMTLKCLAGTALGSAWWYFCTFFC